MKNFEHDDETGEPMTRLNSETGEVEYTEACTELAAKVKSFRIPSSYIKPKTEEKIKQDCSPMFTKAILFLLPPTIFLYPILALLIVIIEAYIHGWAHRKNKLLKTKNHYYQSPLHIICKEFCGACIEESSKLKISKFQEKRADKIKKCSLEYVRRIVT